MSRFRGIVPVGIAVAFAGCEASQRDTPDTRAADAPPTLHVPADASDVPPTRFDSAKPDVHRLGYDAGKRKLRVYELPDRAGQWMLTLPGAPMGVPVDGEYELPANLECDLGQVVLFYTLPNRRPSPGVTLREIVDTAAN
jgi:hypothetical protein